MVQRYELEEMSRNPFESYRCLEENEEGDWVEYEDYAALLNIVYLLTDCVNTDAIPDSLYEKLEEMGLL